MIPSDGTDMLRKRITSFLLGLFFVVCGVAVIFDRYKHGLHQGHSVSNYDERQLTKAGLMIVGGVVGIVASFIGSGQKKP